MNKLVNINFGELIIDNDRPVLELVITDAETEERLGSAYLCYFRKYCMQVCGSRDGGGDYGSTRTIDYTEYNKNSDLAKAEILRTAATAAINSFTKSNYIKYYFKDVENTSDCKLFTNIESTDFTWSAPKHNFYKFIKAVFKYTFPDYHWEFSHIDEEE